MYAQHKVYLFTSGLFNEGGRDNVVVTSTGYRPDGLRFDSQWGQETSSSPHPSRPVLAQR